METTQAETTMEITRHESMDISLPLQTLFDECLNFISVNDFNL